MFLRYLNPSKNNSFFIFGARGTGKTTWLKEYFKGKKVLWLDLLEKQLEDQLVADSSAFSAKIDNRPDGTEWVVVDEIQKIPALLDLVHLHIEKDKLKFALTGSSARKLKRGGANLLAGRAFVYHLYPLTLRETGYRQSLDQIMRWGCLPKVIACENEQDKLDFLQSYVFTYLSEEIVAEQLVRKVTPFRRFLPVAAQSNGQIINYAKIARDTGVHDKNIETYFDILEDTLVGFRLFPHRSSFRKRFSQKPKFYFFDSGVARALSRSLNVLLQPQTSVFGQVFEHIVILEFYKLCSYFFPDYELSYLQTKDGAEVDLLIDRPGKSTVLIEIKSTTQVYETHTTTLRQFAKDMGNAEAYCLSLDPYDKKFGNVVCLPWDSGIERILFDKNPVQSKT